MKKTQREQVLDTLKKTGEINTFQAFAKFNICRLGAIIFNLRKNGMNIKTIKTVGNNVKYVLEA